MFFEQHLIYCIGDFVEISYAIKKEPLLRDSYQMPMVGLEPTSIRTTDFESVSSASSDTSADSIVRPKIYYHF